MRQLSQTLCLAAAVIAVVPAPVSADETGMADMHSLRREGRKLCMVDHFHYGSGTGRSKAAALADAVKSWQDFTNFEYGTTWARWGKASGKSVKYSAGGSGVNADISARACK